VILTGVADWQYQREEAEFIAGNVLGVNGVENDVDLAWPTPSAWDVQHSIKKALERDAKLDADSLVVAASDGTVTLRGSVRSWSEHDAAVGAAWAAPGVRTVYTTTSPSLTEPAAGAARDRWPGASAGAAGEVARRHGGHEAARR
jgi:osmotically-inducible protein OsmY